MRVSESFKDLPWDNSVYHRIGVRIVVLREILQSLNPQELSNEVSEECQRVSSNDY